MTDEFKAVTPPDLSAQDRAINRVADAVHRVNDAIQRAVAVGISVELKRASRLHDGTGNWGDQMVPLVREPESETDRQATPGGA